MFVQSRLLAGRDRAAARWRGEGATNDVFNWIVAYGA